MESRIMYIEDKSRGLRGGPARIGRVEFSKSGKTIYCQARVFQRSKGGGFEANYFDVETGDPCWISGCRRDGADRLPGDHAPVDMDEDVRIEYWTDIRDEPNVSPPPSPGAGRHAG